MRSANIRSSHGAASVMLAAAAALFATTARAQDPTDRGTEQPPPHLYQQTTNEYNRRLAEFNRNFSQLKSQPSAADYRIGPDDQLEINVLEAGELNREPRVSASGEISLALIGSVQAEGLTPRELELVLEELLRRSYIKNPHVNVQVREMQSHPVAVFGAVKKPGVFQVRQPKTVIELLSMAEGLDVDAGDSVIVEHRSRLSTSAAVLGTESQSVASRGATSEGADPLSKDATLARENAGPAEKFAPSDARDQAASSNTVEIDLKKLLDTGDANLNVLVYPGDVVKVPRAGLVYVVGEVKKAGGFVLKSNENISVLQAIALAEGLTRTSSSSFARIIRTSETTGQRKEIPIDVNKILAGKKADPILEPRDILFIPNSAARSALFRGMEAALSIGTGVAVYRR
jgi:polysaccharide export outer membrane protein